jgi:hypothetical protein
MARETRTGQRGQDGQSIKDRTERTGWPEHQGQDIEDRMAKHDSKDRFAERRKPWQDN